MSWSSYGKGQQTRCSCQVYKRWALELGVRGNTQLLSYWWTCCQSNPKIGVWEREKERKGLYKMKLNRVVLEKSGRSVFPLGKREEKSRSGFPGRRKWRPRGTSAPPKTQQQNGGNWLATRGGSIHNPRRKVWDWLLARKTFAGK